MSNSTEFYYKIEYQVEFYRLNPETQEFSRVILPGDGYVHMVDVHIQDEGQISRVKGWRVTEDGKRKRFRWWGRDWTEL